MKKHIRLFLLLLAALAILSGCSCKHEWAEATCDAPKTCTRCGQTEGEPLSHQWVQATCAAPRTCTLCGKARGEALPHTWMDANYQNPKTCSACGETEGKPLTAAFEEHGLVINTTAREEPYDYITGCYENSTKQTVGKLYISNYRIFESDDTHAAVDGYEWRAVDMRVEFSDENSFNYGYSVRPCRENYYDIESWDDYSTDAYDTVWSYLHEISDDCFITVVNYNGTDFPCAFSGENNACSDWVATSQTDKNGNTTTVYSSTWSASFYACVPEGYDGVVVGLRDNRIQWEDGMYVYDVADGNTLFFRMGNP